MLVLHPNILEKKGKKEFVVLPFDEFKKIEEALMDYEDLKDLREAKSKEEKCKSYSIDEVKKTLNIV